MTRAVLPERTGLLGPRRRSVVWGLACALGLLAMGRLASGAGDELRPPFDVWLLGVRAEAVERGIRAEILDAALAGLQPIPVVRERDRSQAEFNVGFEAYTRRWLDPKFVARGREHARAHGPLLARVEARYGVPAAVIVAIWGLESNYGRFAGVRPVIAALATLAYDTRRSEFFRGELFSALRILDDGHVELPAFRGSWAGALGQPQFMPSSYLAYAVDFDGDGRKDIWTTQADVFASMANYLEAKGWRAGSRWGREVVLTRTAGRAEGPASVPLRSLGCRAMREMTEPRPLREWRRLGVRLRGGGALPDKGPDASLVRVGARSFLVYPNYEALLAYNCAHPYALSVALLSDRLR